MFDLQLSFERAAKRLGRPTGRKRRSDAGASRLSFAMQRELERLLHGQERPSIRAVQTELHARARALDERPPSRATIYNFLPRCRPHRYAIASLPAAVRDALYNLDPDGTVPGHQLVYYAFQHGDLRAVCFASGLPWIDLYLADRMRGWRERSHGLLRAVLRHRAIT